MRIVGAGNCTQHTASRSQRAQGIRARKKLESMARALLDRSATRTGGSWCAIPFIDDLTRCINVYRLHRKSGALSALDRFVSGALQLFYLAWGYESNGYYQIG